MHQIFQQSYYVPGTLAAPLKISAVLPVDCTLLEVCATCGGAAAAGVEVGTADDAGAHLKKHGAGKGGAAKTFGRKAFMGEQYPRLRAGDQIQVAVDHDFNGGGAPLAASDVTLVLTFLQG